MTQLVHGIDVRNRILLIPHATETIPPDVLGYLNTQYDIRLASSTSEVTILLQQTSIDAILLHADWSEARTLALVQTIRQAVSKLPIVFLCIGTLPSAASLIAHGILGPLTTNEPTDAFRAFLDAAVDIHHAHTGVTQLNSALHDLHDLCAHFSASHEFSGALAMVLTTSLAVLQRETFPNVASLTGALLCVDVQGRYLVHAATGRLTEYLGKSLPSTLQRRALQTAESGAVAVSDKLLIAPFYWNDKLHGILVVEGDGLPHTLSDTVKLVINHVAIVMENLKLFELAAVDSTTRAFTRTFTLQRLYETLKSTYRNGQEVTLLMMDLDHFKDINDTYGHLTGDLALNSVGNLLRGVLRETDILGRYGGDEFLLILPNTPVRGGKEVAMRIRQTLQAFRLPVTGDAISITISIGIGGISHLDAPADHAHAVRPSHEFFQETMNILIAQADGLMYRAKNASVRHISAGHAMSWGNLLQRHRERKKRGAAKSKSQ